MGNKAIIVIGGSAGGIEALITLVESLPADLPAAIFVVIHVYPLSKGLLPEILTHRGSLPAAHPTDGQPYKAGQIYVAPPDRHLMLENGLMRLSAGPKENRHRPAIDPLFRSAARYHKENVIAVLLSGMLDDGTGGLMAVKMRGGKTIVQSPSDAMFPDMPRNALDSVEVDYILPVADISAQLIHLLPEVQSIPVNQLQETPYEEVDEKAQEVEVNMEVMRGDHPSNLAPLVCPDCGGSLWEMDEEGLLRYRCHVGHGFTAKTLFAAQTDAVEEALWMTLRILKERATMAKNLAERIRQRSGDGKNVQEYEEQAAFAEHQAEVIRKNLLDSFIHQE